MFNISRKALIWIIYLKVNNFLFVNILKYATLATPALKANNHTYINNEVTSTYSYDYNLMNVFKYMFLCARQCDTSTSTAIQSTYPLSHRNIFAHIFILCGDQMYTERSTVKFGNKNTLEYFFVLQKKWKNKITSLPRSFINSMRA